MPVERETVVKVLYQIADLLELVGASRTQTQKYRRAANTIEEHQLNHKQLWENNGKLQQVEGIDESIAPKIQQILETGTCEKFETLKNRLPSGMAELAQLSTVGPKRAQTLYLELGIKSVEDLQRAINQGLLAYDEKTVKKIEDDIKNQED